MISVIFEVWPAEDKTNQYFDIAASLRPSWKKLMVSFPLSDLKA